MLGGRLLLSRCVWRWSLLVGEGREKRRVADVLASRCRLSAARHGFRDWHAYVCRRKEARRRVVSAMTGAGLGMLGGRLLLSRCVWRWSLLVGEGREKRRVADVLASR